MSTKNTGGPAFPTSNGGSPDDGMMLRDYFAANAMPLAYEFWSKDFYNKRCADSDIRETMEFDFDDSEMELIAEVAYDMADAMLKAREK